MRSARPSHPGPPWTSYALLAIVAVGITTLDIVPVRVDALTIVAVSVTASATVLVREVVLKVDIFG